MSSGDGRQASITPRIEARIAPQVELKEMEDVEARISELENQIKLLRNVMVKNGNANTAKKILAEESV